jgi:hypothetical protein
MKNSPSVSISLGGSKVDDDRFGDDRSILGSLRAEDLPKPKGLRLISDGGVVIKEWVRPHRFRGKVEWGGGSGKGDGDVA